MKLKNVGQILDKLKNQRTQLGVENMVKLDRLLQKKLDFQRLPSLSIAPTVIHVGGTNGKGSVSYKISKYLQCQGLKCGLTVSPEILNFRERIQVDGQWISEETLEVILFRPNSM